jgi:hypothetical protein
MSRAPLPPGSRSSRLRDKTAAADFDNRDGLWSRERLVKMNLAYCEGHANGRGATK